MSVHRRQFIIGPRPVLKGEGWKCIRLESSDYLSYCSHLPVDSTCDLDGASWRLIGVAVQTDGDRPDPIEEIGTARTADVPQLYRTWAGRWVLIGQGQVHMDASGLLGCFYRVIDGGNSGKAAWVSSSAPLLAELCDSECIPIDVGPRTHGVGLGWFPPPMSGFSSIYRLLPSQVIDLQNGAVQPRQLVPALRPDARYEELLDCLQGNLSTALRRMPKVGGTIWLPLTGGFDSRLLLALASYSDIKVKAFTQEYDGMSIADSLLPPRLAKEAGVEHNWVSKGQFSEQAVELYDSHTGGHIWDADRAFFARGQWDWVRDGDLIIRGGCFELGRCKYWKKFPSSGGYDTIPDAHEIARGFQEDVGSPLVSGIDDWLKWVSSTMDYEGLDWRDRFYQEQRIAGWLSSIEQSLDMVEGERFFPVNSSGTFATLLSIPQEKRVKSRHHVDLIERLAPSLLKFPFNQQARPRRPLYNRIFGVLTRKVARLAS